MKQLRKQKSKVFYFLLLPCLFALVISTTGCRSTDPENVSSQPWNTPKSWEHGLPGGMFEGR
ncbi:MAG: hypothetical protein K9N48_03770 [Verrucomicrobia bacterium]|nr:hypothetical protein [Verrucomicrobiota bacterium]MCF7707462.1 hypothetical protein [Verrucomicrobiota bacterium]